MNDCNNPEPSSGIGLSPSGMKAALPPSGKLAGLDLGTKTIGVALSDMLLLTATPLVTIQRTKFTKDIEHLSRLIEQHDVAGLVLGLPVEMDGTEGRRCQSVRTFADNIRGLNQPLSQLPVAFWDERLSTSAVERFMIEEMDLSRKKRAGAIDKSAAAWILQGFLDAIAFKAR